MVSQGFLSKKRFLPLDWRSCCLFAVTQHSVAEGATLFLDDFYFALHSEVANYLLSLSYRGCSDFHLGRGSSTTVCCYFEGASKLRRLFFCCPLSELLFVSKLRSCPKCSCIFRELQLALAMFSSAVLLCHLLFGGDALALMPHVSKLQFCCSAVMSMVVHMLPLFVVLCSFSSCVFVSLSRRACWCRISLLLSQGFLAAV